MLFVWSASWNPNVTREQSDGALMRRAQWQYPEGARVLGEYWTGGNDPAVLLVFEADDFTPIFELNLTWGDVFDISCVPAVTAEEGLRIGPEALGRARA
jgi:hypothetical protein